MTTIRRWWRAATTPCDIWPCRRCTRAGRSGWRTRNQWHAARRRTALTVALPIVVGALFGMLITLFGGSW